ncbi:MAG: response regulator, partial [Myxococcota bacterium]|nr:response regulator [Myxococcota bacterium]
MALKSDNPERQALSESEELSLRALPTWELARDGSTLRVNCAAAERFGDAPIDQLFDDRSEFKALVERGFEGVPLRPFDLLNGRRGVLLVEKSEADSPDRIRVGLLDVTHAHLLEQESAFTDRLRAVCNLAAGVAYELSNPLTVLQGRLEFMEMLPEWNRSELEKHLRIVKDHAERISDTVRNLQIFAHPALGSRDSVSLPAVLEGSLENLASRLGRVQVVLEIESQALSTPGDPTLLKQVFTALVLSVADEAGRVGRLVVEATASDGMVEVTIAREGLAQREASSTAAWEVVSETARGAGFGPALAATIVRAHGGQLKHFTSDSQMAYRVELPSSFEEADPLAEKNVEVLFVDDDSELCDLARDMIEAAGHQCHVSGSAEEGIALLEKKPVDLVFADVRLPGMSGLVMQEIISTRWPVLSERVVLVTGLSMRP